MYTKMHVSLNSVDSYEKSIELRKRLLSVFNFLQYNIVINVDHIHNEEYVIEYDKNCRGDYTGRKFIIIPNRLFIEKQNVYIYRIIEYDVLEDPILFEFLSLNNDLVSFTRNVTSKVKFVLYMPFTSDFDKKNEFLISQVNLLNTPDGDRLKRFFASIALLKNYYSDPTSNESYFLDDHIMLNIDNDDIRQAMKRISRSNMWSYKSRNQNFEHSLLSERHIQRVMDNKICKISKYEFLSDKFLSYVLDFSGEFK